MAKQKTESSLIAAESYSWPQGLQISRFGKRCYVYQKGGAFPVTIATAEITPGFHDFLETFSGGVNRIDIDGVGGSATGKKRELFLKEALSRGYLVKKIRSETEKSARQSRRAFEPRREGLFDYEFSRRYQEPTFFGAPMDYPSSEADVGILGVPIAFDKFTLNTRLGYHLLRESAAFSIFNWFEIYREGLFSDINLEGVPIEMGRNIRLKDFGYVEQFGKTLKEIFKEISRRVAAFTKHGIKPLFIGGDHAVTFPAVLAMLKANPKIEKDLLIVHLDAHDDLFFNVDGLTYSHATPFMNILETTKAPKILSFGLRSGMTQPAHGAYRHAIEKYSQTGRVAHYGIAKTLELIRNPRALKALFPENKKIYVSIDVDCLSESLINGAVNAPCVDGLHWSDLFAFLKILSEKSEIIGADVVEFCHNGGNFCVGESKSILHHMHLLLIYLIHILAKK